MILNVAGIRKAFGATAGFTFREPLPAFEGADGTVEFTQPVEVEVRVTNLSNSILLQGQIHTTAKLVCSRCLSEFSLPVTTGFEEEMCHTSDLTAFLAEHPEAEEEENYRIFASDEVDIAPLVSELIVLALPMKPLCREDCQGLCPRCGCNWNQGRCNCEVHEVDPRLAGLADFFAKK